MHRIAQDKVQDQVGAGLWFSAVLQVACLLQRKESSQMEALPEAHMTPVWLILDLGKCDILFLYKHVCKMKSTVSWTTQAIYFIKNHVWLMENGHYRFFFILKDK